MKKLPIQIPNHPLLINMIVVSQDEDGLYTAFCAGMPDVKARGTTSPEATMKVISMMNARDRIVPDDDVFDLTQQQPPSKPVKKGKSKGASGQKKKRKKT